MSLVLLGILIALALLVFVAESNNSKLIIVGGRDGLPLILNTETGGAAGK